MLCGLLLFDISVTWSWLVDCWLVILADVSLSLFSTGNRFCYLSLTALPVDYKALGKKKKQNTPSSVPSERFSLASLLPVLRQRHLTKHLYLKSREMFQVPFAQENSNITLGYLFSSHTEECVVSRHQLCRALPNSLWFYLYVFPYCIPVRHCCIRVAASDHMWQVSLWTPGQAPPRRTKPVP